ncbi:MAG TPA: ATP-binding protein [Terriglobales bacterium]
MTAIRKSKSPRPLLDETRDDGKETRASAFEANAVDAAYRFLVKTGAALDTSLDEEDILRAIATLAIPVLGDWSVIDVPVKDGSIRRISGAHRDAAFQPFLHALQCQDLSPLNRHPAVNYAFEVPRLRILTNLLDFFRPATDQDSVYRMTLLAVGFDSCLVLPLVAWGRVFGVLSVVSMRPRSYRAWNLPLAEEFARRAAQALDNARLHQEVREACRRKDERLALLAHELRNPLTVIRNVIHSLDQRHTGAPDVERGCDVIVQEVRQMSRLIDDVLDNTRGNHGQISLRKEAVNLTALAAQVVAINGPFLDLGRHHLEVKLPNEPVWVDADPGRLEQILVNLLSNAARYTPLGGRIDLTIERDGDTVVLRVCDTGIGIAPEMLRRIFDPFVRTRQARNHTPGGLGIGLTLVRTLVELHGGCIEAASDGPGRGSTFTIYLPVLAHHSPTASLPRPTVRPGAAMRPLQILLADDNRALAETWATLLTNWGHTVEVVHDGPAAPEKAQRERPDIVLLDINLPGLDGYQVARRLRGEGVRKEGLLVAMTGYGQEEDRRRAREAGFDLYLVKPVELEEMQKLLACPLSFARHPPKADSSTKAEPTKITMKSGKTYWQG